MNNWLQFSVGLIFLLIGLVLFIIECVGVFKFKYVMNRLHAAAIGDTCGLLCCTIALMIWSGVSFLTIKIGLVVVLFWLTSPVCSHVMTRMEVTTGETFKEHCEVEHDDK